jgi:hypothetical protein
MAQHWTVMTELPLVGLWQEGRESKVSLRTKLILGYMVFIAALVLLGGWSAWHIRAMGKVAQRILADNYESRLGRLAVTP